jgi:hypothetical protein
MAYSSISIADLLRENVLHAGDKVHLTRKGFSPISAVITADGCISLNTKTYRNPTAAAKAAGGYKSVDGWLRWRVERLGNRTLADIREETSAVR